MAERDEQHAEQVAQGVETLIARLRDEGVEKGRTEAEKLIEDAQKRKAQILEEAEQEAQRRKDEAQKEVARMKESADQALHTAARDTVLTLRQQMMARFTEDIRRLVSQELREEDVFKRLILSVAGRAREALEDTGETETTIVLPRQPPGLEEIRKNPDRLREDELSRLVLAMTGDILREGITFQVGEERGEGIRVVAKDSGLEFDLSDAAIAELLRQHLQPRFRALLEGILD